MNIVNHLHRYVVDETWRNINSIVKKRSLTVLYRDQFDEEEVNEAKRELLHSWYRVDTTILGNDDEKVLLIELKQKP